MCITSETCRAKSVIIKKLALNNLHQAGPSKPKYDDAWKHKNQKGVKLISFFQVIVILWIVALSIFAPVIWVRQAEMIDIVEPNLLGYCIEKWPDNHERLVYGVLCFVFVYAVPGSVVVLAYSLMGFRLCAISPPFDGPGNEGMASTRQVNYSCLHYISLLMAARSAFAENISSTQIQFRVRFQASSAPVWCYAA